MKFKQQAISAQLWIKLATLIALTIAYLFSGCETVKTFHKENTDTVALKRTETKIGNTSQAVAVRSEENRSHQDDEWFRLTMRYLVNNNKTQSGDTTINNFITQPATVIYETGRSNRDETTKTVDSSWHHNVMKMIAATTDSMSRKIDNYEKTKHSETKGIGWIAIMIIGAGLLILDKGLRFLANKYSETKK